MSSDRSPIYVFTDALPSDPHRLPEAEVLITQKSATVSYVMLPKDLGNGDSHKDCGQARRSNKWKRQAEHPYNILTSKTGGRLLNIDTNDLSQIGVFISSATPHSHSTILQASGLLDTIPVLMFPVDTSVEQLIITVTGQELALSLLTPAGWTPLIVLVLFTNGIIISLQDSLQAHWNTILSPCSLQPLSELLLISQMLLPWGNGK